MEGWGGLRTRTLGARAESQLGGLVTVVSQGRPSAMPRRRDELVDPQWHTTGTARTL